MNTLPELDTKKYKNWITDISHRFKNSQIKAATKVNSEMLLFYWTLGKDLTYMSENFSWGSKFYDTVSLDLKKLLPEVKSFSPRNLRYMSQFFRMYSNIEIAPQLGAQIETSKIMPQVDAQLDIFGIFNIPWNHHKTILDKCKTQEKALFYVHKIIENNWSRAILLNFIDTDLYERQGKAITNFSNTLPIAKGDLAQQITKDPYNFDFLTLRTNYDEKELKNALMDNIQSFLLELGKGFSFVGKEYRLNVGETEQFIDMLFYNIPNHCYVVIEIKIRDFEPGDMGQLGTYVAAVDGILKGDCDNETIGLLICKSKDNILAKYALNAINIPIGISEYEINNVISEKYNKSMPTIEEIEQELK